MSDEKWTAPLSDNPDVRDAQLMIREVVAVHNEKVKSLRDRIDELERENAELRERIAFAEKHWLKAEAER